MDAGERRRLLRPPQPYTGQRLEKGTTMAKQQPGNQTAGTPDLSETELREMHIDELRERARAEGVSGASSLRKEELVKAVSRAHREGSAGTTENGTTENGTTENGTGNGKGGGTDGDAGGPGDAGPDGGRIRRGPEPSKSLKYSQEITSPEDEPER